MSLLTPTTTWQNKTLSTAEVWRVSADSIGPVVFSTDADANGRTGISVTPGESIQFAAAQTVYYKNNHKNRSKIECIEVE